jgi:hypothetical protein
MNKQEHLLACLVEECAEVSQRATKALRFGLLEVQPGQAFSNRHRLLVEMRDWLSVADMLFGDAWTPTDQEMYEKRERVQKYMDYARSQGALTDGDASATPSSS